MPDVAQYHLGERGEAPKKQRDCTVKVALEGPTGVDATWGLESRM
ncbi:hypothetical protein A2U01_0007145, partial [Trifolium medium]|nr:hypothetical protein [Trifolium medium]